MNIEKLKYPIGIYTSNKNPSEEILNGWIQDIEDFPKKLIALTQSLSHEKLNWKYRPGGWTIKQVIHHCADSHMNSIIRFKLALTEKNPTIRPYYEDRWAELPDSLNDNIAPTLQLINGLHNKWSDLLRSLNPDQLQRQFMHPEHGTIFNLAENIGFYAWHCNHHLAHIHQALESDNIYIL